MSISEDSYDYTYYGIEFYLEDDGPPLIKKKSRIIHTVVQNDVEGLARLLDSPKWYRVTDKLGYSILQIAILRDNKEVFDYMLSLEDFPIDEVNRYDCTALELSLTGYITNDIWMKDHYAYELLQRDVKINAISNEGDTMLHCALERGFVRVARLLLEKGADVNAQNAEGDTPLHQCFYCDDDDFVEAFTMLLSYGADPFMCNYDDTDIVDMVMTKSGNVLAAQEVAFYYVFDQYSCRNIDIVLLLRMAHHKCPLFQKVFESALKVVYSGSTTFTFSLLFTIEPQQLKVLIEKCDSAMEMLFLEQLNRLPENFHSFQISLVNLEMLMNSKYKPFIIELICRLSSKSIIQRIVDEASTQSKSSELLYYLLSYGMTLNGEDLELIYEHFNHCELFRILLHMDIKKCDSEESAIIPALYYNMNIHLKTFLHNPYRFSIKSGVEELLSYSAHPRLKKHCYQLDDNSLIEKVKKLPQIPLLIELARDVFRKYFIEKLKITTSRRFYTLLKSLPVGIVYKKMITYERKLYD